MISDTPVGSALPAVVIPWQSRPLLRLAIGALILLAEYLALTVAFDAHDVLARGGAWTALGRIGNTGSVVIAGIAAFLLLPGSHHTSSHTSASAGHINGWMLLLHLALAASFAWATQLTFGKHAPSGSATLWVLLWMLLAVSTAASLLVALVSNWAWLLHTLVRLAAVGGVLGMLAWIAGILSNSLWGPLSQATLFAVAGILRSIGLDVLVDPIARVIDLEGFAVEIAPMCSGFEGVGMYLVLMGAFLYQLRAKLRFPRVLILLPIGMALVWFGNSLRIAALMLVGARVNPEVALGSFHSKAGWVFFAAITVAIAAIARKSRFFTTQAAPESDAPPENMAAPLIVPLLAWTAVGLLTSMFSGRHDVLYGARVVLALTALWFYRERISRLYQAPTGFAVIAGLLIGVIWLAVPLADPPENSRHALTESLGQLGYVAWVLLRCIGAVLVIPICEELAFRGYLARRLTRRDFSAVPFTELSWLAVAGSSIAFAAVHERWALGAIAGLAYVWVVRRSGRLADGIVAHATSNAVIAAWVLTTGDWRHW